MNSDNNDDNQVKKFIMPSMNQGYKQNNFLPTEEEYKEIARALPQEEEKKPSINLMANNSTDLRFNSIE